MSMPSQATLHEWLNYDPITGVFTWKKKPRGGRRREGALAGTERNLYIFIGLGSYKQIGAHRIAWVYVHGSIPDGMEIDHKDCDPSNNAIANLRLATSQEQKRNKGVQSNSRSGLKGAYFHTGRLGKQWRSQIKIRSGSGSGKFVFLGYYRTAKEAHAAYVVAAKKYFGEFARAA